MNWLDYGLAIIFLISIATGLMRGFAGIVTGLLGTILGILLAIRAYHIVGGWLGGLIGARAIADLVGFLLILLACTIVFALLGRAVSTGLRKVGLGWFDHLLGGGLGFVRGVLIAAAIVLAIMAFHRSGTPLPIVESKIAPYVLDGSALLARLGPAELRRAFWKNFDAVKKIWLDAVEEGTRAVEERKV